MGHHAEIFEKSSRVTGLLHRENKQLKRRLAQTQRALVELRLATRRAGDLFTLGYNARHAEDEPGQMDSTGTTAKHYRKTAGRIERAMRRARQRATRFTN